jgi:hypothetical protein
MRVQPQYRTRHERHRGRRELADHCPVEPRGRVDRQQADRHRVIPGQLVIPDEQPGDADRQGRLDRGQAGHRVREPPQHQRHQDTERNLDQQGRGRRQLVPERGGDELVEVVGADLALAPGQCAEEGQPGPPVGRGQGGAEPGQGRGQRHPRPAERPRQREPEQQVGQHDVGGHADQDPGGQGPGRADARPAGPQHGQPGDGRGGRQHVEVTAGDQCPEHQRVHRPEQVCSRPVGRVRAQQPVQAERHAEEDDRVPQLQPCRDRRRRGAAQPGRRPLLRRGQRPVE